MENNHIELFNRMCRQEMLNCHRFETLGEVRHMTSERVPRYNEVRPHEPSAICPRVSA